MGPFDRHPVLPVGLLLASNAYQAPLWRNVVLFFASGLEPHFAGYDGVGGGNGSIKDHLGFPIGRLLT